MVLGMSISTFTLLHVLLSLAGIGSGFVVVFGLIAGKRLNGWTGIFLATTILTSVTGFLFPFHQVTPGIILGVLSLIVLAATLAARYAFHLSGAWRSTYVITAVVALYFNCFVAVVQAFEKVPALKALAPTQKESPFAAAQLVLLILFVVLGWLAVRRFRLEAPLASQARA
ncbi:MAG TPA: hypothetical protein VG897_08190 [Terriglobales bacterium]|nr:hypothetical protein [Terriglobales bacterium]